MGAAVAIAAAPHRESVWAVVAGSGFARLRAIISNRVQKRGVPSLPASPAALIIWAAGCRLGSHLPDSDLLRWASHLTPRINHPPCTGS
jgi:hypothetical protein